jgi:hypothetical protein
MLRVEKKEGFKSLFCSYLWGSEKEQTEPKEKNVDRGK